LVVAYLSVVTSATDAASSSKTKLCQFSLVQFNYVALCTHLEQVEVQSEMTDPPVMFLNSTTTYSPWRHLAANANRSDRERGNSGYGDVNSLTNKGYNMMNLYQCA